MMRKREVASLLVAEAILFGATYFAAVCTDDIAG